MPDLAQSLHGHDLGHLHIIADLWGLDLEAPDVRQGRRNLARGLLNEGLIEEVVEALPQEARDALGALMGSNGRIPWSQFIQRFGEVREMGPGRRDREKPFLNPVSTSEILWYRALAARAFFDFFRHRRGAEGICLYPRRPLAPAAIDHRPSRFSPQPPSLIQGAHQRTRGGRPHPRPCHHAAGSDTIRPR
jgi:hypothetical protein